MSSNTRQRIGEADDVFELSGWSYADLFLGLSVIFLATISFVPKETNTSNALSENLQSPIKVNSNVTNLPKGLVIKVGAKDADEAAKKIQNFMNSEQTMGSQEVIFAQIIGGYDSRKEDLKEGQLRAIAFAIELNKKYPEILRNSQKSIDSSASIPAEVIAVRLTFGEKLTK